MKLGTENKKQVYWLIGLGVVGLYFFYANVLSSPAGTPPADTRPAARAVTPARGVAAQPRKPAIAKSRINEEFRPSLKHKPDEGLDPMSIDPTLRLDLLAKIQGVPLEGGARNLFQFGAPPAPPLPKGPEPTIKPKTLDDIAKDLKEKQDKANAPPAKPLAPPINLKYYGYSTVRGEGRRRAFFLDGEDILVASEGDMVKKRYRVVRIGVNSVVMEDTESKSQQTLPLAEEAAAG